LKYTQKDFGAVEIGLHKFNQEPANTLLQLEFIIMWQFTNNKWQITKVISLH
jgi:hypothetical protein